MFPSTPSILTLSSMHYHYPLHLSHLHLPLLLLMLYYGFLAFNSFVYFSPPLSFSISPLFFVTHFHLPPPIYFTNLTFPIFYHFTKTTFLFVLTIMPAKLLPFALSLFITLQHLSSSTILAIFVLSCTLPPNKSSPTSLPAFNPCHTGTTCSQRLTNFHIHG